MVQRIILLWKYCIQNLSKSDSINLCYPLVFIHILSNKCLPYEKPNVPKLQSKRITLEWCGLDWCGKEHFDDGVVELVYFLFCCDILLVSQSIVIFVVPD